MTPYICVVYTGTGHEIFYSSGSPLSHEVAADPLAILLEARFEPCQVCGEQSSGLHCGAITCEACKVKNKTRFRLVFLLKIFVF